MYALRQHRALDIAAATGDEIGLLAKLMAPKGRHQVDQAAWEAQLQLVLHLLAQAIGAPFAYSCMCLQFMKYVYRHACVSLFSIWL